MASKDVKYRKSVMEFLGISPLSSRHNSMTSQACWCPGYEENPTKVAKKKKSNSSSNRIAQAHHKIFHIVFFILFVERYLQELLPQGQRAR